MALDENKLKQALIDNYQNIKDNRLSIKDSADGMAKAIVDYATDAEVIINAPPTIPGSPPVPDTSVVGKKAKVTTPTIGQRALQIGILGSLTEMINGDDDEMALLTTSIVIFAATFLNYKSSSGTLVKGTTLMSSPPILKSAIEKGMKGGKLEDVVGEMTRIINKSFKTTIFTGVVTNPSTGATIPGTVVGTLQ
tara:strand:+ start:37 stop:618 length:582 start_codon:yes stop_codon:yes gene_type:complete